jgi:hypothetical protein
MSNRSGDSFQFDGFDNPTTTPVPDIVFDQLLAKLGEAELKALLYIIRRTFGFKRDRDPISFNQFLRGITTRDGRQLDQGAGIRNRTTLSTALKALESKRIIESEKGWDERGENQTTVYRLRFKSQAESGKGVVRQTYHPSTEPVPPVVRQTYPQQTVIQETEKQQHSVGVVGELKNRGMTMAVAQNLASKHDAEYIAQKIDLVAWLVEHQPKAVGKNPAGYLRRAIEEDYQPPPGYQTEMERAAAAETKRCRQEELAAIVARQQAAAEEQQRAEAERRAQALAAVRGDHPPAQIAGTSETTETAWQKALQRLQESMTAANYKTWLAETTLVSCDRSTAVLVAPNAFVADWLRTRFALLITRYLSDVIGVTPELQVVPLSELRADEADHPNARPGADRERARATDQVAPSTRRARTVHRASSSTISTPPST